jgi:hypothetical protein
MQFNKNNDFVDRIETEEGGEINNKSKQYDELLNKLLFSSNNQLFGDNTSQYQNQSNSGLNDSRISQMDKDLENLASHRDTLNSKQRKYKYKMLNLEKELGELENIKSAELDHIRKEKEKQILNLKEKIQLLNTQQQSNLPIGDSELNQLEKAQLELETLKSNLAFKENNYKSMIKSLMNEWKNLSLSTDVKSSSFKSPNREMILDTENNEAESIFKELGEILTEDEMNLFKSPINNRIIPPQINSFKTGKNFHQNFTPGKSPKSSFSHKLELDYFEEDSMVAELKEFKKEDLGLYKFDIPLKYQLAKNVKVSSECTRPDGKLVKYYENSVVEIITKNKTVTRVIYLLILI